MKTNLFSYASLGALARKSAFRNDKCSFIKEIRLEKVNFYASRQESFIRVLSYAKGLKKVALVACTAFDKTGFFFHAAGLPSLCLQSMPFNLVDVLCFRKSKEILCNTSSISLLVPKVHYEYSQYLVSCLLHLNNDLIDLELPISNNAYSPEFKEEFLRKVMERFQINRTTWSTAISCIKR